MTQEKLVTWLFQTDAVRVCPENKPFWYTSGTIGPYYINTHFLYGNEKKANELLAFIDTEKGDKTGFSGKLLGVLKGNYAADPIYHGLIDEMLQYIKKEIGEQEIQYVSGGERRDWFFSLILADMLDKPHITLFKDLSAVLFHKGVSSEMPTLKGGKVLHIADLITEASSYERAWIPAVKGFGGEMAWSLVVVDRKQGGGELLERNGVKSHAMVAIDRSMFSKALEMGLISNEQKQMLDAYADNPKQSMKDFLQAHPEFMENALNGDEKTRERARLCLEKKIYA